MPTLVLRFPGGLYHATPSGHHVNEGIVEWPPSPWRLTRALLACGYTTQRWDEVPPVGRRLFEALSGCLPEYRLPPAALGHSRHYMPTAVLEKGREKTTLVLDTFADVGDGQLWVRWPVALDDEASALFTTLVEHLGYLGRSESWVIGRTVAADTPLPDQGRAFPHLDGERPARGFEQLTLTAPEDPSLYAGWRKQEVEGAMEAAAAPTEAMGKAPSKAALKKKQQQIEESYPLDVLACLQCDTSWWKQRKWSQAPGSRRVLYWREAGALEVGPASAPKRPGPAPIECMLFALTTPSGARSALPTTARTLPQAELLHKALVSKLGFGEGTQCPELTGRSEDGAPLKGHRHAHVLPIDLDDDGHLDHIVLYVPQKLGALAQHAARSVKRTYTKGGVGELQVALAGQGALSDLRSLPGVLGDSIGRLLGPSREWRSATPFVVPRHLKKRGANTLEGQVNAELAARGLPAAAVEVLPWNGDTAPLRHFVRRRGDRAPQPVLDAAFVLRLSFEEPVAGPICLGYASHFGLGRFEVATAE